MIFLIEYDRRKGKLVDFREFADSARAQADDARLELELHLHRMKTDHEVVLLQARDRAALRRTHNRYFADLPELIEDFKNTVSAFVVRERKE